MGAVPASVSDDGVKIQMPPTGRLEQPNVIVSLNPLTPVTVTVADCGDPNVVLSEPGVTEIVKELTTMLCDTAGAAR
jgi:hypothetical protein